MKILLSIVLLSVFFLSCASSSQCPPIPVSPPEDIIIITGYGPVKIRKGMIEPDNYYTMSEWDEFMKSYYNSLNPANNM